MNVTARELAALTPLWIVSGGALLLLLVEALFKEPSRRFAPWLSAAVAVAALAWGASAFMGYDGVAETHFAGAVTLDAFAQGTQAVCLLTALLASLFSGRYLRRERAVTGEYYALVLFGAAGLWILAGASEFITLFVGLELASLPAYVLAGYLRTAERPPEAAFKYFIQGSFASAFLLYGVAVLYGVTGSTRFAALRDALVAGASDTWAGIGAALLLTGLGFKVALAPFHAWAPDVYEGAPAPVSGFLATGVKAAGFAALTRVLTEVPGLGTPLSAGIAAAAVLTMFLGNLGALAQASVKRMLAYSSVAHAGYVAIGLAAAGKASATDVQYAVGFYLLAYSLMTAGAFAITAWASGNGEKRLRAEDWAGLGLRHPWAGAAMAVFLFSLTGIPPMAGFFGKWFLFKLAVDHGMVWLALLGVLNSFLSAYYYLRVVVFLFMRSAPDAPEPPSAGFPFWAGVAACALGSLLLGFAGFLV